MRKRSPFLLGLAAIALAGAASLTACGGGGSGGTGGGTGTGGNTNGGCFDYTSFDGTTPVVSFQADVLPLFRQSCGLSTSCHQSENGPGGQHFYGLAKAAGPMTAAQIQTIFDQSVGKPSVDEPSMNIITPGAPGQSFLMYKLDGDPTAAPTEQVSCATLACAGTKTCGESMPEGGPAMLPAERDTIRRWIAQGAKND